MTLICFGCTILELVYSSKRGTNVMHFLPGCQKPMLRHFAGMHVETRYDVATVASIIKVEISLDILPNYEKNTHFNQLPWPRMMYMSE